MATALLAVVVAVEGRDVVVEMGELRGTTVRVSVLNVGGEVDEDSVAEVEVAIVVTEVDSEVDGSEELVIAGSALVV